MKPRLLQIAHCYFNRAGTEEHIKALERGLADRWDILTVAPKDSEIQVIQNGVVLSTFAAPVLPWPLTPYNSAPHESALAQVLNNFAPDLVHVHHLHNWPLSLLDNLIAYQKPVLMTFHDYHAVTPYFTMQGARDTLDAISPEYSQRIFKADISAYLHKRLEVLRRSIPQLSVRISPSDFTARQIQAIFPESFNVIEHGIDPFNPLPKIPSNNLRFGYLGSLLPQKGWDLLETAFERVHREFPHTELHFFGGKPPPEYPVKQGNYFHGIYNRPDIPYICSQIDVGFVPTMFAESFGLVISELWQGKIPLAVSDIGAFGERVIEDINGKKFRVGDIKAIEQTMRWFITNQSWKGWELPVPRTLTSMLDEYDLLYNSLKK